MAHSTTSPAPDDDPKTQKNEEEANSTEEFYEHVESQATDETIAGKVEGVYDASSIQVLKGLEAVRLRPGMYVGDNGKKGLHQMFREVLDNGVDEALAGYCDTIKVTLYRDGSLSVEDNGRGIPVDIHPDEGISALTVIMTQLHAGGKFGGGGYKVSGGLHGVGVSCTNALSLWMETKVKRDGKLYFQRFEQGVPIGVVEVIGESDSNGTIQTWMPDPEVLHETTYDENILLRRLKEIAYLNKGLKIIYVSEIEPENDITFFFEKGIVQLVEDLNEANDEIHKPIYFHRVREGMELEVAIQYNTSYHTNILAYTNNIHQPDGGTHVSGFGQAMTRVLNAYARKMNLLKEKDKNFTSDDVSEGLTAVIALKIENPSYNSQDKVKLVNPEVQGYTHSLVGDGLQTYLEENPQVAKRIIDKAMTAQTAREAARKAAEAVKRSSAMDSFGLPGKLSDCRSKHPELCELFLVEGDSAGGSAKGARDRETQAVLPLRGKILNVERARIDKALDNQEIKSLIAALGIGLDVNTGRQKDEDELDFDGKGGNGTNFDLSKLRYHKVIIMTDADVDGEHIRTLLLTFFYRYMKPLVTEGYVYLAQPPLFVVKAGANERYYAQSEAERDEIIRNLRRKNPQVTRFKGLGEMNPDELEETTMAPANRRLIQVQYDKEFDYEVDHLFSTLMGDKVEPRRDFIEKHARKVGDIDWHY